ncbi:Carbon-nitrogen hydrolase [Tulasnella sp. 418]|nr:Carbon-nitrogen hydrolase [Tulasnella sp. 418]
MAFTGYIFPSYKSLEPYLELPGQGPTSDFCTSLAKRLECYVIAGYPERLLPTNTELQVETSSEDQPIPVQLAGNSTCLFAPDGTLVGGYRKTNLYEADMPWAQAGEGFSHFDLPPPLNRLSIGICMDLNSNPKTQWENGLPPCELADYCIDNDVRLLVVPCAWKDSDERPNDQWDTSTIDYWVHRLWPLWGNDSESSAEESIKPRKTIVVICDRSGFERGTLFAGTSAILSLEKGSGKPEFIGVMKRREEKCQLWTIDL